PRRRQCAAPAAAADHRRRRRGRCARPPRPGLHAPGTGRREGSGGMSSPRHFLDLAEFSGAELRRVLDAASTMKSSRVKGQPPKERPLAGKVLAMIFDKPSTRTRVSFDVGMRELGGETIMLPATEMQLGRSETIADTAKVLSRYVDIIMIRTTTHARLLELAENATGPVINGLTD